MPKTLISFVGTGRVTQKGDSKRTYEKAQYSFKEDSKESSFIASALAEFLELDHVYLLGTVKSMWEEVYRYYCEKNNVPLDEDYYFRLADSYNFNSKTPVDAIDVAPLEAVLGEGSRVIILPYGVNETEQWDIFSKLEQLMESAVPETAFYLDITHAFRSMPIFSMTSILYMQDVLGRNLQLKGIYYGMFEVKNEYGGVTPIVDLSLIIEIQEWIKAAHSFLNFGKGYLLAELLDDEKDAKEIVKFTDVMSLNYLDKLDQSLTNLKRIAGKSHSQIAKHILPKVLNELAVKMFKARKQSNAHFQLELANWHFKQKNYALAYLVLVEAMVTYYCEKYGMNWKEFDDRQYAKTIFQQHFKQKKDDLSIIYKESNQIRNKIAHDIRKGKEKAQTVINNFTQYVKIFTNHLNQY